MYYYTMIGTLTTLEMLLVLEGFFFTFVKTLCLPRGCYLAKVFGLFTVFGVKKLDSFNSMSRCERVGISRCIVSAEPIQLC